MDIQQLILATLIATLRRQFPPWQIKAQIFEGLKYIRELNIQEAIAKEAGEEPTYDTAILELNTIITSTNYQEVVSYTVTKQRTAKLGRIEMACENASDYGRVTWKITLGDKIKELKLPTSLTLDFADLDIRGGKIIKVEAKTSSGTPKVWADITGKEII